MDLTESAQRVLLAAPRNFGLGYLIKMVVQMIDAYAEGRQMNSLDKQRAFRNLIEQVLKEAQEQEIIDLPHYVVLLSFIISYEEQVEDIRRAYIEVANEKKAQEEGVAKRCLPCKKH